MNSPTGTTPGNTLDSQTVRFWYKVVMHTDLLREHAQRCRMMVDGASPLLAATFLQLAKDLEAQADDYERDEHIMLRRHFPTEVMPPRRKVSDEA